jgi:hypothetical protein
MQNDISKAVTDQSVMKTDVNSNNGNFTIKFSR